MRKIKTKKSFFEKHYYSLAIFAFMIIYSAFVSEGFKLWVPDDAIKAIHAVDFGLGFCSKLLPGAVYNIFFDKVDDIRTTAYLAVLLIGFFAVLSLVLEKFLLSVKPENRKTAIILLAFFLTGPSTFAIHIYYPGMLDMYWVFTALLLFVLLSKKQLTPLLFLPFVLCVTVYFASLICFIPFFVIIILYKISCCEDKKEKGMLWGVLIVSAVVAVALGGYLAVYEYNNLKYSYEEFYEIYSARGVDNFYYYDLSLFKLSNADNLQWVTEEMKAEYYALMKGANSEFEAMLIEFFARIKQNLTMLALKEKTIIFAVISPVAAFMLSFIFNQMKLNRRNGKKLKAFTNFCLLVLPFFTVVVSILFSEDLVRWIAHAFLVLFAGFLYIVHNEKDEAWCWIENKASKLSLASVIFYFIFYAPIVYHPYAVVLN